MSKKYSKQWSAGNPGLLVYLIDQSDSMSRRWTGNKSLAEETAMAINRIISELISASASGEKIKDRVYILLIGYGNLEKPVRVLKSDFISDLANTPLRVDTVIRKTTNSEGGLVDLEVQMPVFLDPVAEGNTPLGKALEEAENFIRTWIQERPDCPAPIIMNVTDGLPYDGTEQNRRGSEPELSIKTAKHIMQINHEDGSPLIFHAHIGFGHSKVEYPAYLNELPDNDNVEILYYMSSVLPPAYREEAEKYGLNINRGGRALIMDADLTDLIKMISLGSTGALPVIDEYGGGVSGFNLREPNIILNFTGYFYGDNYKGLPNSEGIYLVYDSKLHQDIDKYHITLHKLIYIGTGVDILSDINSNMGTISANLSPENEISVSFAEVKGNDRITAYSILLNTHNTPGNTQRADSVQSGIVLENRKNRQYIKRRIET